MNCAIYSSHRLFSHDIYVILGVNTSITPFVHRRSVLYTRLFSQAFFIQTFFSQIYGWIWSFERFRFLKYALHIKYFSVYFSQFDRLFPFMFLSFSFLQLFLINNLKESSKSFSVRAS